jgi:hypothetical protein
MQQKKQQEKQSITVKLLRNNSNGKVVYMEVNEDFLDFFCSMFQRPLGNLLEKYKGTNNTMSRLYGSVTSLKDSYFIKPKTSFLTPPTPAPDPNQRLILAIYGKAQYNQCCRQYNQVRGCCDVICGNCSRCYSCGNYQQLYGINNL